MNKKKSAKKKQTTKLCLQNFEKTFNLNCIMLKNQRLESKHCRSRSDGSILLSCSSSIIINCISLGFPSDLVELLTEAQQTAKQSHNEAEHLRSKLTILIHVHMCLFFSLVAINKLQQRKLKIEKKTLNGQKSRQLNYVR